MARFQKSSSWTRAETLIQGDTRGPGETRPRAPARTRTEALAWRDSRSGGPRAGPGRVHAIGLVNVSARAADAPSWQAAPTVSRAERAEPGGGAVAGGGDPRVGAGTLPADSRAYPEPGTVSPRGSLRPSRAPRGSGPARRSVWLTAASLSPGPLLVSMTIHGRSPAPPQNHAPPRPLGAGTLKEKAASSRGGANGGERPIRGEGCIRAGQAGQRGSRRM